MMRIRIAGVILFFCASIAALAAAKKPPQKKPPQLGVLEFGAGNEIKWSGVQWPNVVIPLTIENRGKTKVKKITVTVSAFQGSGRTAKATTDASTFDLDAHKEKQVNVTVRLPVAATYKSQLRVDAGGTTAFNGSIELDRKYAKAPLEIESVAARQVTAFRSRDVHFDVKVRTTGDTVTLDPPELLSITYKEKPASTFGVPAPDAELKVEPPDVEFKVARTPQTLKLALTNIRRAGLYEGRVRFGGEGYEDTIVPLAVYVREPSWILLLIIALGVGVSFYLRSYTSVLRPRLLNERRVATLFRELDEHAHLAGDDAAALSVVQHIRRALTISYNDRSATGKLTDPASFDLFDLRIALLPRWITMRKRAAQLQPESLRKPFEDRLTAAQKALVDDASDATKLTTVTSDLDTMPVDIDDAIKVELRKRYEAFKSDLADDRRDIVKPIVAELTEIAGDLNSDRLAIAATHLDRLQRRYVRILADDLSSRLSSDPPIGVSGSEWPATLSTLTAGLAVARTATTAAAATEAFRSSLTLFLNTALAGLRMHMQNRVKNTNRPDLYKPVQDEVAEVAALIGTGDLLAAWKKLADAEEKYRAVIMETTGGSLGAMESSLNALKAMAAPAAAAGDSFDPRAIFGIGASTDVLQQPDAMKTIDESIRRRDIVFTLIVCAIAVLIGVKTLWADNPTWGGWVSYLAAFLWGAGFDQFSHAGLVAMINKT